MVDWGIEQSLANGLPVTLDFHYFPLFSFTTRTSDLTFEAARAWYLALWKQIAEHYNNASMDVMFELMNEPSGYLGPFRWNELLNETITLIRRSNPGRTIIVGPECYQQSFAIDNLRLPENDRNIIVAIHCYKPEVFTHQGASWAGRADVKDIPWEGSEDDQWLLIPDFYNAAAWGEEHNRPLVMNEFGVIRYADVESAVRWLSFVTREAEKMRINWAVWAYNDGAFGFYDGRTESWKQPHLDAVIPPE